MLWIVLTDSNHCRILNYEIKPTRLSLIQEISHEELRLKKSEYFTVDKPGRYQMRSTQRGAFADRSNPKDVAIDNFLKEIVSFLDDSRKHQRMHKFVLIAPPQISGHLLAHLDKNLARLLLKNIQKDYLHQSEQELLNLIHEHMPIWPIAV